LYDHDDGNQFCKDGINDYLIGGNNTAINHQKKGTKASADYVYLFAGESSSVIRLRLCKGEIQDPFGEFDRIFDERKNEADNFYDELQKDLDSN
jgi:hypothetical protein